MDSDKVARVSPRLRQQRAAVPSASLSSFAAVTLWSKSHKGGIDPTEGPDFHIAEWTCTDLLPQEQELNLCCTKPLRFLEKLPQSSQGYLS